MTSYSTYYLPIIYIIYIRAYHEVHMLNNEMTYYSACLSMLIRRTLFNMLKCDHENDFLTLSV